MLKKLGCLFIVLALLVLYISNLPFVLKYQYPLKYQNIITQYSKQYNLHPTFIAAIIDQESGFKPAAVSKVGAIGLMQLLPSTAKWIASKIGEEFVDSKLVDPQTNIKYGCWYIRYLLDRYNQNEDLTLAAYNSGTRLVDSLNGQEVSLKTVYTETYKFVVNTKKAELVYKSLYGSNLSK